MEIQKIFEGAVGKRGLFTGYTKTKEGKDMFKKHMKVKKKVKSPLRSPNGNKRDQHVP